MINSKILLKLQRFNSKVFGATKIDYGLILAGLAIVIIGGLALVGS